MMIHQKIKYVLTLSVCLIVSISVNPASAENAKCVQEAKAIENFILHDAPKPVTKEAFLNLRGESETLEKYAGNAVVLNHWAIWCAPCIREMPSVLRLSEKMAGKNVTVMALSMDRAGVKKVNQFVQKKDWAVNIFRNDPKMKVARKSGISGIPATQIINKKGEEIGRLVGTYEWDAAEVVDLITCLAQ